MFRHKVVIVTGFVAVAVLSLLPIFDLDLAAAESSPWVEQGGFGDLPERPTRAAQAPVRVGEGQEIDQPEVLHKVDPAYPEEARRAGLQGAVVLEVTVDAEGAVEDVTVIESIENAPMLSDAAVEAIRQWKFEPTELDGSTVSVLFTVTVRFRLH